jgi:hypothetical protein
MRRDEHGRHNRKAVVPWEDVPRHLVEKIALEGYQEGWLSEEATHECLSS